MKAHRGSKLLSCLAFGVLSLASTEVGAQCTIADCPGGSNIRTTPPYVGTPGVDCFIGTSGPDTMLGFGGDDYLCGG